MQVSEKKMNGEDGLRTLECLRGRLFAERQASKVAKEDAELMSKKITELENQLKEETKLRKKGEKRLKFLMKKLESLKGSHNVQESSEQSSSSEISAVSCVSSTGISGSKEEEEEDQETKTLITNPENKHDLDRGTLENNKPNQVNENPPMEENSSPQLGNGTNLKDPSSGIASRALRSGNQKQKTGNISPTTVEHPTEERGSSEGNVSDNNEDYVNNSMALVPVDLPAEKKRQNPKLRIANKSVGEVLDALRHARERIQSSLERRKHKISVGTPQIHSV